MTGSVIIFTASQIDASHEDLQIVASCTCIGVVIGIVFGAFCNKLIFKEDFPSNVILLFAAASFVCGFGVGILLAAIKNSGV